MSRQSYSSVIAHSNDTDFRTWGQQLSNALQACGLTKTSDTGQINWATVTRPAVNALGGYEIYRFNDAHQAVCPIFLRVEYRTNTTATTPNVYIYVGVATNGAGQLVAPVGWNGGLGAGVANGNIVATAVPTEIFYSADLGVFTICWGRGVNGAATVGGSLTFAISRFANPDGTPTDKGFTTVGGNATSTANQEYDRVLGVMNSGQNQVPCLMPSIRFASGSVGTTVQTFNHYGWTPAPQHLVGQISYFDADIPMGTEFVAQHLGAQRTFLATGVNGGQSFSMPAQGSHRLAILLG